MTLTRTRAQMVRDEAGGGSRRKKEADELMQTAQQLQPDFPPVHDYFRYRQVSCHACRPAGWHVDVCMCTCIFYVEIAPFRRHLPLPAGVLSRVILTRARAWRQLLEHKDAQTRAKKSSARARQEDTDVPGGPAPPQDEGAVSAFTCLQVVVGMRCLL